LFAYWLIGKVYLVEITTGTTSDAYQIFETMNDRGLRLTPAEMLKGFLLMEIRDGKAREDANAKWKDQIDSLSGLKNGDVDLIKSWLRGRHAATMTDFENIWTFSFIATSVTGPLSRRAPCGTAFLS